MSLPWVGDSTLLWDTLILGGEVWPGLPTVSVEVSRKVDVQKTKGDDGATLADQGYEPAKVKISLRLWLQEQWVTLQRVLATVHPRRKGGTRTPLDIYHPATQLVGVRQVYVTKIGNPTPGSGSETGLLTMAIEAIEWFPAPRPAKAKLKKSKSNQATTGGEIPDPLAVQGPHEDTSTQDNADLLF